MNIFDENENITLERAVDVSRRSSVMKTGDVLDELKRDSSWNNDLAIIVHGSLYFPDGVYTGSWNIYHEFAGQGTYTLTNGTKYNGIWNPINQIGIGTITFPSEIMEMPEDGNRVNLYNGSWNNNFEFIVGNLEFIDGTYTNNSKSYNGVWNPDKSGTGTVTVSSSLSCGIYTGSWDNNFVVTGQGTFTLNTGIIYDGEWNPLHLERSNSVDFSRMERPVALSAAKGAGERLESGDECRRILSLMGIGTITFLDGTIYTGSWNSNLELIGEGVWSELKSPV